MYRLFRLPKTLWNHKKKTVAFAVGASYALYTLNLSNKDDETRRFYAEKARRIGQGSVKPNQKVRHVTVLVNKEAGRRKAAQLFDKNCLPLLNLAGLDVNVIQVNSASEMEQIARVIDRKETDCLLLVGGDGTVSSALAGICERGEQQPKLPIGLFPGGRRNKSFAALDFLRSNEGASQVRLCCESAMALIEDRQRIFYPIKCSIVPIDPAALVAGQAEAKPAPPPQGTGPSSTFWLISELSTGLFDLCEQKAARVWGWLPRLDGLIYAYQIMKFGTAASQVEMVYEKYCPGCKKCLKRMDSGGGGGLLGWIGWLTGLSGASRPDPRMAQLGQTENPECGTLQTMLTSGQDIRLRAEQERMCSKLGLHVLITVGRLATIREAWNRVGIPWSEQRQKSRYGRNSKVATEVQARRIRMHFVDMPKWTRTLTVAGEQLDFEDFPSKELVVQSSRRGVPFFVPPEAMKKEEGEGRGGGPSTP